MLPSEAVRFLLDAGALHHDEVVGGTVEVRNVSRRNNGLTVACTPGPSFYVKEGIGDDRRRTVASEARMLVDLRLLAPSDATASFLPEFVAFDADRCVLVTRLVPNGRSLTSLSPKQRLFSTEIAGALGGSLGTFHRLVANAESSRPAEAQDFVPFPFRAVEPELRLLLSMSGGNVELVRVVQNTAEFLSLLREVRVGWRNEHLIHGDLRLDNCVFSRSGRRSRMTIVDWELSGRGDPDWDVGTVVAEFIGAWLLSIPIVRDTTAQQMLSSPQHPFMGVQLAIAAFATAYHRARAAQSRPRSVGQPNIAKFVAVRLIQMAFEQLQAASEVTGQAAYLLQLSLNLLQKPETVAAAFLGLAVAE